MNRYDVTRKLNTILAAELDDTATINLTDKLIDGPFDLDSIALISLLLEVEEAFDMDISDEEAETFLTVGDVVDSVCEKLHIV